MIGLGKEVVQDELVIENTRSGYQNVQVTVERPSS